MKNFDAETHSPKSKTTFRELLDAMLPLSGFLLYGIYVIFSKLGGFELKPTIPLFGYYLNVIEFLSILLLLVSAIAVLLNLFKSGKKSNEFQKVLLAHSFTWIGVQTMFIYALFYLKEALKLGDSAGSVNSIAFFVLSLVSAVYRFGLESTCKKIWYGKNTFDLHFYHGFGYASILFFRTQCCRVLFSDSHSGNWLGIGGFAAFAIMSEKVDQTKMGLYMGIFNLAVVLPQLVASFKMGEVINTAPNKSVIFAICAVTLTISGVLWLFVKNEK